MTLIMTKVTINSIKVKPRFVDSVSLNLINDLFEEIDFHKSLGPIHGISGTHNAFQVAVVRDLEVDQGGECRGSGEPELLDRDMLPHASLQVGQDGLYCHRVFGDVLSHSTIRPRHQV